MLSTLLKLVLVIIGLFNAIWLIFLHYIKGAACSEGGFCADVVQSSYGVVFGIPVGVFGASLFVYFLSHLLLKPRIHNESDTKRVISLLPHTLILTTAYIAIVYFVLIQFLVIKQFCVFCMINHALVFSLVLWETATMIGLFKNKKNLSLVSKNDAIVGFLLLPLVIFLVWQHSVNLPYLKPAAHKQITRIDGKAYSLALLELKAKSKLYNNEQKRYDILKNVVNEMVLSKAAKSEGLNRDDYVRAKVVNKIRITNQDILTFLTQNKDMFPKEVKASQKRKYAKQRLYQERMNEKKQNVLARLYKRFSVQLGFSQPKPLDIAPNNYLQVKKGADNALLHVIVFSDYECPACARAHKKTHEFLALYPNEISVEYRHFPLSFHRFSTDLARYAICLSQQNLFWEFSRTVFENQKNISLSWVEKTAKTIGANQAKLDVCLNTSFPDQVLKEDMALVNDLNLSSTPSIFINGSYVEHLPTKSELKLMINETRDHPEPVTDHHNH